MGKAAGRRADGRAGFTLVEVLIAMVVGVIVLAASTQLVVGTYRGLAGTELRDGVDRNARFIGIALQRDIQEAGVGLESQIGFGTVATFGDTLAVLQVPFFADEAARAYPRSAAPPAGVGRGNCGTFCIEVSRDNTEPFQVEQGDLAYVQVGSSVRRLILVGDVTLAAGLARIGFSDANTLVGHAAGIAGAQPLDLNAGGVIVRKLLMTAYWRDGQDQVLRATRLNPNGTPAGDVVATGVSAWNTSLEFTDGGEAAQADASDADDTNDYVDIRRVHVRATLRAERTDPRVNGGALIVRPYDWWFAPRNLIYERNRRF